MNSADDFNPQPGRAVELEPGLRRILAPNPSPMTFRGTNTYLIGTGSLAVIDPGPECAPHLEAILAAVQPGQRITHIVVTHSHLDHSPLARGLSQATGAPVYAFGGAGAGRSAVMSWLAASGLAEGGEGIDTEFAPDITVRDSDVIGGDGWELEVIHTPGHLGNHIALAWNDACFTADHVMGWASSLVSPPDGDLTDFMDSCRRLRQRSWRVFHPGHGAPVTDPAGRLDWLIAHRQSREAAILQALGQAPATARALAEQIYTETPPALLKAAERNVFAHLVDLSGRGLAAPQETLSAAAVFARRGG
ncbi:MULTISPECIES: MBL fold metallo-hydrolase [Leisingera]|jgi:glyoxylase-like metal-dependent hydrolase (beta-lactamase superfamily II)|uniref:MBL fold metallo-hydrolase n=1 Tax=Leisingera TaxID=191028 RepID=UPI0011516921|nr:MULTISPECIES: MBL fold metallo-hydrolase [Leisingera]QDI75579.1 MBL fold metallo-hydrolase [Leisingera aquaemixtae]